MCCIKDFSLSYCVYTLSGTLFLFFFCVRIQAVQSSQPSTPTDRIHLERSTTLRSCPAKLPPAFEDVLSQNRVGKQLVVISVHPQQKDFVSNNVLFTLRTTMNVMSNCFSFPGFKHAALLGAERLRSVVFVSSRFSRFNRE